MAVVIRGKVQQKLDCYYLQTKSSKGEKVCVRDHQSLWRHRELVNPTWQQETDGQRLTMLLFR